MSNFLLLLICAITQQCIFDPCLNFPIPIEQEVPNWCVARGFAPITQGIRPHHPGDSSPCPGHSPKDSTFSVNSGDFLGLRSRFLAILGSRMILRSLLFQLFLKTVILPKSCSRCGGSTIFKVRPSKNRCGEQLQTAQARKKYSKRFGRRFQAHFFGPGCFFLRFWAANWVWIFSPGPRIFSPGPLDVPPES